VAALNFRRTVVAGPRTSESERTCQQPPREGPDKGAAMTSNMRTKHYPGWHHGPTASCFGNNHPIDRSSGGDRGLFGHRLVRRERTPGAAGRPGRLSAHRASRECDRARRIGRLSPEFKRGRRSGTRARRFPVLIGSAIDYIPSCWQRSACSEANGPGPVVRREYATPIGISAEGY
jgi:hypothetical protein